MRLTPSKSSIKYQAGYYYFFERNFNLEKICYLLLTYLVDA